MTVGFHRGLTHGGYRAIRPVHIALAVAGSMSFQGDVIGWVATHRRHHAFTDRPGDPHSPYRYVTHLRGQLRGLAHSHVGWLFGTDRTPAARYAPDLLADRDIRTVSQAFPVLCVLTLALPFTAGWALGGTWLHAVTVLLWAGLVRIALLHHVTWSVNSLCHLVGERPFRTRRHDRATNLWPCSPSARAGTTFTTPTPPAPATASTAASSTPPPPSSASSNAWAGYATCAGPPLPASPPPAVRDPCRGNAWSWAPYGPRPGVQWKDRVHFVHRLPCRCRSRRAATPSSR